MRERSHGRSVASTIGHAGQRRRTRRRRRKREGGQGWTGSCEITRGHCIVISWDKTALSLPLPPCLSLPLRPRLSLPSLLPSTHPPLVPASPSFSVGMFQIQIQIALPWTERAWERIPPQQWRLLSDCSQAKRKPHSPAPPNMPGPQRPVLYKNHPPQNNTPIHYKTQSSRPWLGLPSYVNGVFTSPCNMEVFFYGCLFSADDSPNSDLSSMFPSAIKRLCQIVHTHFLKKSS